MHPNRLPTKPTTSLKRHFLKCKEYLRAQRGRSDGQLSSTLTQYWGQSAQNGRTEPLTKLMLEEEILKFVISANLPFSQVENEHFRKIISWIPVDKCPAQAPSRKVVRARLSSKSEISKENLRKILIGNPSKISLALDCWSTRTNYGFLGIYLSHCDIFRTKTNIYIKPSLDTGSMRNGTSMRHCWTSGMYQVTIRGNTLPKNLSKF